MESINELAKALSAFQSECEAAHNDSDNPAFKRGVKTLRYASLAAVWKEIRPLLGKHGLAVVQLTEPHDTGACVATVLMHTSGQTMTSRLVMPLAQKTPHAVGSAITYARRYSLCAMLGIVAEEDDDGNEASAAAGRQQRPAPRQEMKPEPKSDGKPPSTAPVAVKGLLRKYGDVFTLDPKDAQTKREFVAYAQDKLHTQIDLAVAENWTDSMVSAIGQELSKVEVGA